MNIQNTVLLASGIINLIMSVYILSRGWKNKVNLYFSLLTFFNSMWAAGLIVINAGVSHEMTRFFASFIYPVALMIIVSLFYFIIYFPYKTFELSKLYRWLINIFIVVTTLFCIFFYKIFVYNVALVPKLVVYYEIWSYSAYSLVLTMLMLSGVIVLFSKLKKSESVFKFQLKLILVAVIMGTIAGSYFNLFLMYFHNCDYNHLGPLFTLLMNFAVFYLIMSPKIIKE
ncbi:hypothetical protein HOB10_03755 [Candidatus Parcubacteria bacterium]|jgi:hypothetical protein|nr:hypothetical protein [Candidatus Parcubacteria bacterium]